MNKLLLKALGWTLAGVALAAVYMAYQNPHLARDLAAQLWACF